MPDVAIAILAFPVRVAVTILRHPRYLVLIAIGIFAIMGIRACSTITSGSQARELPKYQIIAPSIESAPYVVQTSSRIYYTSDYADDNRIVTLNGYYTYVDNKWQRLENTLFLDRVKYGRVKVYERTN